MKDLFGDSPAIPEKDMDQITRQIMLAMALLWTPHPRTTIFNLLRKLDLKHSSGRMITVDEVKHCTQQLLKQNLILESRQRSGYYRLTDSQRSPLYEELLNTAEPHILRSALHEVHGFNPQRTLYSWPLYDREATVAIVRLALLTRAPKSEIDRMAQLIGRSMDWNSILLSALLLDFSEARLHALIRRIAGNLPIWR
ncbi:MAG: hypothetical protein WA435_07115 [Gallionellaceae bacterium]